MISVCSGGKIFHLLMSIYPLSRTESKSNSVLPGTGPGPVREASPLLGQALLPPGSRAGFDLDQRLLKKAVFGQACNSRSPLGAFSLSYLCWAAKIFT